MAEVHAVFAVGVQLGGQVGNAQLGFEVRFFVAQVTLKLSAVDSSFFLRRILPVCGIGLDDQVIAVNYVVTKDSIISGLCFAP